MKRKYPVIDVVRTGQNIKRIMHLKGLCVKDIEASSECVEIPVPWHPYPISC